MFRNASLQINCRFLKFFFGESILFAGGLVGGMATKHTIHYTTTIELTEKIHSRDQINIVVIKKHFFFFRNIYVYLYFPPPSLYLNNCSKVVNYLYKR